VSRSDQCPNLAVLRSRLRAPLITIVSPTAYPKHFVGQALRRVFSCEKDSTISRSFEHRRQWIEDRLYELAGIFSIDLCGYAVMSNHYHVVLHMDQSLASEWTAHDVIEQWHQLFSGNFLSQRYQRSETLSGAESTALSECVETWRSRLMDISWFMRVFNEGIAR